MSTKKSMNELGIHNPHNYAEDQPFIYYVGNSAGMRGWRETGWRIHWKGHSLSDHFYDYGDFIIDVYHPSTEKEAKLEEAKAKFHELFDEKFGKNGKELVLTPFSSWMYKDFVEKRNAEIKKALKAK